MAKYLAGPPIALTYDNTASFDGTGAQVQRILGVYAVCKRFKIPYVHSRIADLIITPLDPFQTESELGDYLNRVNDYFSFPSSERNIDEDSKSLLQTLTRSKLLEIRIRNKIKFGQSETIAVANPFRILNQFPNIYRLAARDLNKPSVPSPKKRIVLHYRRGSNTLDILPGESSPRALFNEWYVKTLRKYVSKYLETEEDFSVEVYTDMPKATFTYYPMTFQSNLWANEPRYSDGAIEMLGEDLQETVFHEFGKLLTVHHGGDPLQGLIAMSQADILITSRSSYSYVGGLLNLRGQVIIPPGFWHQKLDGWTLEP